MQPQVLEQRIANARHDVAFYEAAAIYLAKQAGKATASGDPAVSVGGFLRLGRAAKRAQSKANRARSELRRLEKVVR